MPVSIDVYYTSVKLSYGTMNIQRSIKQSKPPYGPVRTTETLGALAKAERKRQNLTLERLYSVSGLSTRFLSQFERGKPNASLCRVMAALQMLGLEMVVLPRGEAAQLMEFMRVRNGERETG